MAAIEQFTPGFRLIDGDQLNQIVDEVNNLTGNGTASPITGSTISGQSLALSGALPLALSDIDGGLTAHAGGGQASALLLAAAVNVVTTVGTAADSVKLPVPTAVGQIIVVVNGAAANSMQVFGSGTDTINGVATGTGVAQAAGKAALFIAQTTGTAAAWWRVLSA